MLFSCFFLLLQVEKVKHEGTDALYVFVLLLYFPGPPILQHTCFPRSCTQSDEAGARRSLAPPKASVVWSNPKPSKIRQMMALTSRPMSGSSEISLCTAQLKIGSMLDFTIQRTKNRFVPSTWIVERVVPCIWVRIVPLVFCFLLYCT